MLRRAEQLRHATTAEEQRKLALPRRQILETEEWRYPGSISYQIKEGLSTTLMYDGDNLHQILTVDRSGASFQFILLGGEDPAIAVSLFQ